MLALSLIPERGELFKLLRRHVRGEKRDDCQAALNLGLMRFWRRLERHTAPIGRASKRSGGRSVAKGQDSRNRQRSSGLNHCCGRPVRVEAPPFVALTSESRERENARPPKVGLYDDTEAEQ